jgi:hypothetical protein
VSLKVGDTVQVLEEAGEWLRGVNGVGEVGYFPAACVTYTPEAERVAMAHKARNQPDDGVSLLVKSLEELKAEQDAKRRAEEEARAAAEAEAEAARLAEEERLRLLAQALEEKMGEKVVDALCRDKGVGRENLGERWLALECISRTSFSPKSSPRMSPRLGAESEASMNFGSMGSTADGFFRPAASKISTADSFRPASQQSKAEASVKSSGAGSESQPRSALGGFFRTSTKELAELRAKGGW